MPTAVMIGPDPVYVDYASEQPLDGFHSRPSAAAFTQGLLTKSEAMAAEWKPAAWPTKPKATWRR